MMWNRVSPFGIIALAAFFCFLSSCTLEKRHHLRGYHVDWLKRKQVQAPPASRKDKPQETNRLAAVPTELNSDTNLLQDDSLLVAQVPVEVEAEENPTQEALLVSSKPVHTSRTRSFPRFVRNPLKVHSNRLHTRSRISEKPTTTRKIEWFGVIGTVFGIVGWVPLIILELYGYALLAWIVGAGLSTISWFRFEKNEGKYKWRLFSWLSILINGSSLVFVILFLLFVIVYTIVWLLS